MIGRPAAGQVNSLVLFKRRRPRVATWLALIGVVIAMLLVPVSRGMSSSGTKLFDLPNAAASGLPHILPTPQQMTTNAAPVPVQGAVTVVAGPDTDASALSLVRQTLERAGARVQVSTAAGPGKNVYVGTLADNPTIKPVLDGLKITDASALPADGYVLTTGRYNDHPVIVLNGVDARGTFYAAQTLRQLVGSTTIPGVTIRDWPLMSIRGAIEGFYGIPWSQQARLDQLAFDGRHKLNTYIYTPKDDLLLRAQWRQLYSGTALDDIRQLVNAASANYVDFTYALSPGNDICYSSQSDFDATVAKFEQLHKLGVTHFYIALDDIPLQFHCASDRQKYPDNGDWHWLADAQADYLNRIEQDYIEPNHLAPLETVPTNYSGSGEDPYKGEFGDRLDDNVRVQWTGEGVFSDTITDDSVIKASHSYRTNHLFIWDNFPVNDGARSRLFLNPLIGRAPDLYKHIDGITSNPMIESYASMPALASYADYTWNGPAYDADTSMTAALNELAGPNPAVQSGLATFADLNQSWPYRSQVVYAPKLNADMSAFWSARAAGNPAGTQPLRDRLQQITTLPAILAGMAQPGFAHDAGPWITAASQWATALQHELAMLDAISAGNGETATREYLAAQDWISRAKQPTVPDEGDDGVLHTNVITPSVGDGAFESFTQRATDAYTSWLGVKAITLPTYPATGSSSMGTWSTYAIGNMVDGDASTFYWSNQAGQTGDWVQVDLGSVREIGSVAIHQSDSDNQTGDMFYNSALEYSVDGSNWSQATTFSGQPLLKYAFDTPAKARYVRLRATQDNPGGQWVKIREFQVSPPSHDYDTNLAPVSGQGAGLAFDADVTTFYQAATKPVDGSYLARNFDQATSLKQVTVIGAASGDIQTLRDGVWTTIGTLDPGKVFNQVPIDSTQPVTGVRVLFAAGSPAPQVRELITN